MRYYEGTSEEIAKLMELQKEKNKPKTKKEPKPPPRRHCERLRQSFVDASETDSVFFVP